jgi:EAL domain-containing protein (putative c-di-GMP-specific phosphodiesterase class I)
MRVVAEGVETPAEAAYLVRAGCQTAQGHYFSEPLAIEDFEALVVMQASHRERSSAA